MSQIDKDLFESTLIKNLISRLNVCAPNWHETDCITTFHKFYYFLKGEGTIIIQGDEFKPKPGELFLIPANTIHTYYHNKQNPVYKYWCHFDFVMKGGQKLVYSKNTVKFELPKEVVAPIFDRIVNLHASSKPLDALIEKASLLELLKIFLENVDLESIIPCNKEYFVDIINEYILRNISNEITLKQLADIVHFHPNYFIQYFKKQFLATPIEYISSTRLNMAKQLLSYEKEKSISDIAYEVGFNDYRYFSRLFKKKYGITPSLYKRTK